MLSEKILKSLYEDCGYEPNKPLVLGVSGGADSLALAHCLWKADLDLIVGHLDHGLRSGSAQEAAQVKELMHSWGLIGKIERIDVKAYAQRKHLGVEEAARICRYEFLFRLAEEAGAQGVAVAHTSDDQVETVLMHFMRGAGINGLRGMQARSLQKQLHPYLPLLRPMLRVSHEEAVEYCHENSLPFITDESNADPSYFRNRLRLEVIPMLQQVNPAFKRVVLRNALALQSDAQLLAKMEETAFSSCLKSSQDTCLILNKTRFLELEEGLQRRVLMHALSQLVPNLRNISYTAVERVRRGLLTGQTQLDFLANVQVQVDEKVIYFVRGSVIKDFPQFPQILETNSYAIGLGEPLDLANDWKLSAEMVDRKTFLGLPLPLRQDAQQAWLNPADLALPLEVRSIRPGERWSPLGMQGKHQKLSDFFVNEKIPQGARAKWPLVLSEGSILWVCGLRIAQAWRLIGDEPEILHLFLTKPQA